MDCYFRNGHLRHYISTISFYYFSWGPALSCISIASINNYEEAFIINDGNSFIAQIIIANGEIIRKMTINHWTSHDVIVYVWHLFRNPDNIINSNAVRIFIDDH